MRRMTRVTVVALCAIGGLAFVAREVPAEDQGASAPTTIPASPRLASACSCELPLKLEEKGMGDQTLVLIKNPNSYDVVAEFELVVTGGGGTRTCHGPAPIKANKDLRACVYFPGERLEVKRLQCVRAEG